MNAGRHAQAKAKLIDSVQHGAGCELILVEGDSAARSVANVRDERTQAVLPLQGKPLNAWRASPTRVAAYPWYVQLAIALGLQSLRAVDRYGITVAGEQYTGFNRCHANSYFMIGG